MPNYLITGMSGAVKSTTGSLLQAEGCSVTDANHDGSSRWLDSQTLEPASYTQGDGEEKLASLVYYWNQAVIIPKLEAGRHKTEPHFFDGYAENLQNFYSYFEKMFLFTVDASEITHRLSSRITGNWGKDSAELKHAITHLDSYDQQLLEDGAISVDATQPKTKVAQDFLNYCGLPKIVDA